MGEGTNFVAQHVAFSNMMKMADKEVFHDAVDWKDILEKKQKELSKQDQVVVELQKKIDEKID